MNCTIWFFRQWSMSILCKCTNLLPNLMCILAQQKILQAIYTFLLEFVPWKRVQNLFQDTFGWTVCNDLYSVCALFCVQILWRIEIQNIKIHFCICVVWTLSITWEKFGKNIETHQCFCFLLLGDGTTNECIPILTTLPMSGIMFPTMMSIFDCTEYISAIEKKNATFIMEQYKEKAQFWCGFKCVDGLWYCVPLFHGWCTSMSESMSCLSCSWISPNSNQPRPLKVLFLLIQIII